jgi:hypothetical protein
MKALIIPKKSSGLVLGSPYNFATVLYVVSILVAISSNCFVSNFAVSTNVCNFVKKNNIFVNAHGDTFMVSMNFESCGFESSCSTKFNSFLSEAKIDVIELVLAAK